MYETMTVTSGVAGRCGVSRAGHAPGKYIPCSEMKITAKPDRGCIFSVFGSK